MRAALLVDIPTVSGQSLLVLDQDWTQVVMFASSSWVSWVFAELCAIRAKIKRIVSTICHPITSSLIYYLPDVGPEGKYAATIRRSLHNPFAICRPRRWVQLGRIGR